MLPSSVKVSADPGSLHTRNDPAGAQGRSPRWAGTQSRLARQLEARTHALRTAVFNVIAIADRAERRVTGAWAELSEPGQLGRPDSALAVAAADIHPLIATFPATLLSLVKPRICRRGANRGQNNDESLDLEDELL